MGFVGSLRRKPDAISGYIASERGSTLVELVVAAAIVGVALAAFITALSAGALSVSELSKETVAQNLAQRQIEQIKNVPYDATGTTYAPVSAPTGYSIAIDVNSALYADSNVQKITVTVSKDTQSILTMENYKVNR